MRITKEPEVRKQEILEHAIRLFTSKGYEKTSISDIAKSMGVSQGLCYRYFPSKEAIYDATIEQYADFLIQRGLSAIRYEDRPLREKIRLMSGYTDNYEKVEQSQPELYELFHKEHNSVMHDQLYLHMSAKLVKIIASELDLAKKKGEIQITDTETAAYFFVYGQVGMLRRDDLTAKEKSERIQNTLIELLSIKE